MATALLIVLLVISFLLIILIYIQSGKVKNVGSGIIGTQNAELFENIKRRGSDRVLHFITVALIATFFILSFTLLFI